MLKSRDIYIDLGTTNTLIYTQGKGFVLNEPSFLAVKYRSQQNVDSVYASPVGPKKLIAIGRSAKSMLGKTPEKMSVIKPLKEGVIVDIDNTTSMLEAFIQKVKNQSFWLKPRMIISLPCQVTKFERRAVEEVGLRLGASRVDLLSEPMAAAIGMGLPVLNPRGQMVVDIGGGTTEVAIISLGGIVSAKAIRIGGDHIDDAIIEHLKEQYQFLVGEQTAEKLKVQIGALLVQQKNEIEVGGFNLIKGLPEKIKVNSHMIEPAIKNIYQKIIFSIQEILSEMPPEICNDIATHGIYLTGGGSLLRGLDVYLGQNLQIPVHKNQDALYSVASGGAQALENNKLFDAIERFNLVKSPQLN